MTAILLPSGRLRYHAYIDGVYGPAVGYKLYTYEAGTTTPKATYADAAGDTPLTNPIELDALGECAPYGTGSYKLELTDPDDAVIWSQDDVYLTGSVADEEWCGAAGGTADALVLDPGSALSDYQSGQRLNFIAAAANTTAVTVVVSGLAAKAITKNGNAPLEAGDLVMGRIHQIQYDGTRWQLLTTPLATLTTTAPALSDDSSRVVTSGWVKDLTASETQAGIAELATAAEYAAGTDAVRALTPAAAREQNLVLSAAQATTSGATKDFTGIPAWAKRVTVSLSGVSNAGGNRILIQLGTAGGIESTGYECTSSTSSSVDNLTTAFIAALNATAPVSVSGHCVLTRVDTNEWIFSAIAHGYTSLEGSISTGRKTLSGALTQIRLLNAAADTFDAGKASIIYE